MTTVTVTRSELAQSAEPLADLLDHRLLSSVAVLSEDGRWLIELTDSRELCTIAATARQRVERRYARLDGESARRDPLHWSTWAKLRPQSVPCL